MVQQLKSAKGLLLAGMFVLANACGGAPTAGPKPLQWHYDDAYIAQLSPDDRESVLRAQNEYHRARAAAMQARAKRGDRDEKMQIAKNERKKALQREGVAEEEKAIATASGDGNKMNIASRNRRVAQLARRATDEKITYLQAYEKYMAATVYQVETEVLHKEALFEYEKAKLGQEKNVSPKSVNFQNFQSQIEQKNREVQTAQLAVSRAKQVYLDAEKKWKERLEETALARGIDAVDSTPIKAGK